MKVCGVMSFENYEMLQNMLQDLRQNRDKIQEEIQQNLARIQESDYYLQSIMGKEESDYKVFSPRSAENIYKDELNRANADKISYQKRNAELYHESNKLSTQIEVLEKVLQSKKQYLSQNEAKKKNMTALNIQEADRQRIARDLHDTALQNLAHLVHKVELSSMFIEQDPVRAKLELSVVSKNLKDVIDEIRNTIFDLRPMTFDDLGLKETFERLVEVLNENRRYEMDLDLQDVSCENSLILLSIYRVVQECFNNIIKHAEASKILFHCKQADSFCVIDIEDNGKGYSQDELNEKKEKHFGKVLMQERVKLLGGKFVVYSEVGKGTKIHIEVPLN